MKNSQTKIYQKKEVSEPRWQKLIKPLLPNGETLLDLGSNAGYYLKKAKGFKTTGIEIDEGFVAQAKGTNTIQMDLNDYDMPLIDVVLMANIIYWLTPEQIKKLVKKLESRALYVIVIGRYKRLRAHKSDCRPENIKRNFKKWDLIDSREDGKHISLLFKNRKLESKEIDKLMFNKPEIKKVMIPAYMFLIDGNPEAYHGYLRWRGTPDKERERIVKKQERIARDILKNGIKKPIKIKNNIIYDGDHRVLLAKHMGFKTILCQK